MSRKNDSLHTGMPLIQAPPLNFNLRQGSDMVLRKIKATDFSVMINMLLQHIPVKKYTTPDIPYVITDIGGGDGRWLLPYFIGLGMHIKINVAEPNKDSLLAYQAEYAADNNVTLGKFLQCKLEMGRGDGIHNTGNYPDDISDVNGSSCLTVCSHSLYYSRLQWEAVDTDFKYHLFTKKLDTLQQGGLLCVILQSEDKKLLPKQCSIHAELENITYTIRMRLEGRGELQHTDHVNYTNAERFEEALERYNMKLKKERGEQLHIFSQPAISQVNLGNINFKPDQHGRYTQADPRTQQVLAFYTNGYFEGSLFNSAEVKYTSADQQKIIDLVKDSCKTPQGSYAMTHLNRVFLIKKEQEYRAPTHRKIFARL